MNANWNRLNKISQDYSLLLVEFLAMQKFMRFFSCFHVFPNKILMKRELALRFWKTDIYDFVLIIYYLNDHTGINAYWNQWLAQVATIFLTQVSYMIG